MLVQITVGINIRVVYNNDNLLFFNVTDAFIIYTILCSQNNIYSVGAK